MPFIPRSTCNRYLRGMVTSNMVCAGGARNKGMCFGDSGGPLVWYTGGRYQLQGVVSWTPGIRGVPKHRVCAYRHYPGVYVDVRRFVSWIRANTGGRSNGLDVLNLNSSGGTRSCRPHKSEARVGRTDRRTDVVQHLMRLDREDSATNSIAVAISVPKQNQMRGHGALRGTFVEIGKP